MLYCENFLFNATNFGFCFTAIVLWKYLGDIIYKMLGFLESFLRPDILLVAKIIASKH